MTSFIFVDDGIRCCHDRKSVQWSKHQLLERLGILCSFHRYRRSYPQQPAELYGFATYNMPPESWQADPGFQHIDPSVMPVDTMTLHYGMYGHVASMSNSSYAPVQSPLDSPTQPRNSHSDPDASWRSLFAQFNQA